ncbi:MAG TPA: 3-oxoacyl-ACP reductase [Treponema sp.]|nr:MAG: 3-oxoacyl-ACP reductase [Treponema sp. GWA1_62_8]OHE64320.1 MAG: 3-oxoacyl-ACP reductase [Treponema sp. GWC1_61_84]OHE68181.1 MAG: 3-oxoacyl-ACP reductase [Treponema sp. RIFOXYC1_FULL_61_9]HCM27176.1 3-oxoacyl-ACP reductase [Treponema sp.]
MHGSTERKTALVTGAAGVLGLAITKALLAKGLRVVMTDMDQTRLDVLAAELGGEVFGVACNLTDPTEVERAVATITERAGDVDVLVNNAGILSNNKTATTSSEEWRKVMDVNVNGVFYITKAIVPGMKRKGWGRIINMSSLAAKSGGITAGTAYSTSKGAIISLTFSLAAELASAGITVNGIAPAYIRTPMVTAQLSDEQRAAVLARIPVGRFCEPEECAHVVCFLADESSGFITGEIIDQNGGLHFD